MPTFGVHLSLNVKMGRVCNKAIYLSFVTSVFWPSVNNYILEIACTSNDVWQKMRHCQISFLAILWVAKASWQETTVIILRPLRCFTILTLAACNCVMIPSHTSCFESFSPCFYQHRQSYLGPLVYSFSHLESSDFLGWWVCWSVIGVQQCRIGCGSMDIDLMNFQLGAVRKLLVAHWTTHGLEQKITQVYK